MSSLFDEFCSYLEIFTGSLSVISCLWYFSMYFREKAKPAQLSLLFILLVSDCLLSVNLLLTKFFPELMLDNFVYQLSTFLFTLTFSMIWSAIIAYFVYKSFLEYDFSANQMILRVLVAVTIANFLFIFG